MINEKAAQIVLQAEEAGLTHQKMADICGIKVASIYRWKKIGRAKANVISKLQNYLDSDGSFSDQNEICLDKPLSQATIKDLCRRARELGFRASFTDIS